MAKAAAPKRSVGGLRLKPSRILNAILLRLYPLQSESNEGRFYVGLTDDLKSRLQKHNTGGVPHTAKFLPWKIKTAIAFSDRERAADFERYLKSASGRAFAKKRL